MEVLAPTRLETLWFAARAWGLRTLYFTRNAFRGRPSRLPQVTGPAVGPLLAESTTPLRSGADTVDSRLELGKIQNLRTAARRFHGLRIPAGAEFSFWRQAGHPWRLRGYVVGRELREGCLVPSVGGGLCQLSNALYDVALTAGCTITERHAHSRIVPGSLAERGRDATVFWNYVDLRFRPPVDLALEMFLTETNLTVRLRAVGRAGVAALPAPVPQGDGTAVADHDCYGCARSDCFRSDLRPSRARRACRAAFLVAAWTPEFDAWIAAERADRDTLFLPIDGRRFRRPGYAWTVDGCAEVHTFPVLAIMRGRQMRRLGEQGAARRRTEERFDARFAETYAARLDAATTRLIVAQSLAPHLWRAGAFGGRRVDVLMTRPPIRILQERLDRLAARYPDSPTAADFRTDLSHIDAEDAALASARTWITPNADVAALAGSKAVRIPWRRPPASRVPRGRTIVFPGPTVARKGCWTVREAVRTLGARLAVVGSVVEGPDFWAGLAGGRRPGGRPDDRRNAPDPPPGRNRGRCPRADHAGKWPHRRRRSRPAAVGRSGSLDPNHSSILRRSQLGQRCAGNRGERHMRSILVVIAVLAIGACNRKADTGAGTATTATSAPDTERLIGIYATSVNLPGAAYGPANLFDGSPAPWATMPGADRMEGVMLYFASKYDLGTGDDRSVSFDALEFTSATDGSMRAVSKLKVFADGVDVGVAEAGTRFSFPQTADEWGVSSLYLKIEALAPGGGQSAPAPTAIQELRFFKRGNEVRILPVAQVRGTVTASSSLAPEEAYSPFFLFDSRRDFGWAEGSPC